MIQQIIEATKSRIENTHVNFLARLFIFAVGTLMAYYMKNYLAQGLLLIFFLFSVWHYYRYPEYWRWL